MSEESTESAMIRWLVRVTVELDVVAPTEVEAISTAIEALDLPEAEAITVAGTAARPIAHEERL